MGSDLYVLDASTAPHSSVTNKNVCRQCHVFSGGEGRSTQVENLCIDLETCLVSPSLKEPPPFTTGLPLSLGHFLLPSQQSISKEGLVLTESTSFPSLLSLD